jgi:membrane protease YdiL (CAAX protease family)
MNRQIVFFAALSIGLGAFVDLVTYWLAPPGDAAASLLWGFARMYTPALASVAVGGLRIIRGYIRLDARVLKYYLLSPLFAYVALALYMLLAAKFGLVELGRLSTLVPLKMDPTVVVLVVLLNAYIAAITVNALFALGEEIGWRGFLQDALESSGVGPLRAALVAGVLWGVWHAPAILLLGYNYPDGRPLGLFIFVALTVSMSLPHWISRASSASILPAASLHGCINAIWGITVATSAVPRELDGLGPPAIASWAITSAALYLLFKRSRYHPSKVMHN